MHWAPSCKLGHLTYSLRDQLCTFKHNKTSVPIFWVNIASYKIIDSATNTHSHHKLLNGFILNITIKLQMTNKVTQLRTSSANPHLHNNPRPCRLMSPGRCQTADPVTAVSSTTLAPVNLRVSPGRCQITDPVTPTPSATLTHVDLCVSRKVSDSRLCHPRPCRLTCVSRKVSDSRPCHPCPFNNPCPCRLTCVSR